jgi:hypothetical protein
MKILSIPILFALLIAANSQAQDSTSFATPVDSAVQATLSRPLRSELDSAIVHIDNGEVEDTTVPIRILTLEAGVACHTMTPKSLINIGLGYETDHWRFAALLGHGFYLLPAKPEVNDGTYTERWTYASRKLLSGPVMLNMGAGTGFFEYKGRASFGESHWYYNGMFLSLLAEASMRWGSVESVLMYQWRISRYEPANVIGLWVRYRIAE